MRVDEAGPRTWLLATVAGWAALAWLLALAGMGRHAPQLAADEGLLRPLPQTRAPAPERLGPLSQYAQIGQRPLFTQDRQPKPFFMQGQGEGEGQSAAFDYQLTSVLITPGLQMAILQPADGSESVRVRLGEAPESHAAWRLTALDARSAVFEGPEGRREMTLRVFDGLGGQPPTAVGNAAGNAPRPQPVGVPVTPPGTPAAANAARVNTAKSSANTAPASSPNAAPGTTARTNPPPATPPASEPSETAPMTPEAQMEAIRKRIEARRAQMRQQQAAQPPAQTP